MPVPRWDLKGCQKRKRLPQVYPGHGFRSLQKIPKQILTIQVYPGHEVARLFSVYANLLLPGQTVRTPVSWFFLLCSDPLNIYWNLPLLTNHPDTSINRSLSNNIKSGDFQVTLHLDVPEFVGAPSAQEVAGWRTRRRDGPPRAQGRPELSIFV